MATFLLELVSPEKLLLSRQVEMATIPGVEGEMGVLPGHSPMIVVLRGGVTISVERAEAEIGTGEYRLPPGPSAVVGQRPGAPDRRKAAVGRDEAIVIVSARAQSRDGDLGGMIAPRTGLLRAAADERPGWGATRGVGWAVRRLVSSFPVP